MNREVMLPAWQMEDDLARAKSLTEAGNPPQDNAENRFRASGTPAR
jgi:hypothetical protein